METLKPLQPEVPQSHDSAGIPTEFLEAGINFKNVQFLDHLGLRDEMFNQNVMEKVEFLASKLEFEDLVDLDMRLGEDGPKIDKLYSYLKLIEQSDKMKERQELISDQIQRYEQR